MKNAKGCFGSDVGARSIACWGVLRKLRACRAGLPAAGNIAEKKTNRNSLLETLVRSFGAS